MVSALRGGAREPADPARGARADPGLPQLYRAAVGGDGGAARRRLRPAADRAGRACAASACSPPSPRPPSACSASRASPSSPPPGPAASRTGSTRDFVRHLSAVADAGSSSGADDASRRPPGAVRCSSPTQVKGLEFDHVYLLGLRARAIAGAARGRTAGCPPSCSTRRCPSRGRGAGRGAAGAARPRRDDPRPRRRSCSPGRARPRGRRRARRRSTRRRATALGGEEEIHEEELFGPAEGLHATYRMLREEVLEASWRAGRELSEPRLDTAVDVNRRGRPLPGAAEARGARSSGPATSRRRRRSPRSTGCWARSRPPSSRPSSRPRRSTTTCSTRSASADAPPRARRRPRGALAGGVPAAPRRRPGALGLRPRPLPDLPAEVQVRARLRDPPGADDQPALRDPDPQRARALPHEECGRGGTDEARTACEPAASTACWPVRGRLAARRLRHLRRRAAVPRPRARRLSRRYQERQRAPSREPVWLERSSTSRSARTTCAAGSTASTACPDGGYELIDYKTGERKSGPDARRRPAARALPARRPRGLGHRGRAGSYYYVLDAEKVAVAGRARRRRAGRAHRARGRRAGIEARTSSRAPRTRSAAGATTG